MGNFFLYAFLFLLFSIVCAYFFYGQKQHFFFEEWFGWLWCTRALRNQSMGRQ